MLYIISWWAKCIEFLQFISLTTCPNVQIITKIFNILKKEWMWATHLYTLLLSASNCAWSWNPPMEGWWSGGSGCPPPLKQGSIPWGVDCWECWFVEGFTGDRPLLDGWVLWGGMGEVAPLLVPPTEEGAEFGGGAGAFAPPCSG